MLLAYIDCFAGLSGATFLEALVGVGLSRDVLDKSLEGLPGAADGSGGETVGPGLDEFRNALSGSRLPVLVKQTAGAIIRRLREAETAVHNEERLRGIEVSGWRGWDADELRAAVGVVLGLSMLGIVRVECSPLRVDGWLTRGGGRQVGADKSTFLPITAEILCGSSVPVYGTDESREFVTPVGASLVCTLVSNFGPLPLMTIRGIGYGKEEMRQTRVFIGERVSAEARAYTQSNELAVPVEINAANVPRQHDQAAATGVAHDPEQESGAQSSREVPASVSKSALDFQSTIVGFEEWVALSIKGHQQSGRQRV